MRNNALVIIVEGFEELEAVGPIDCLRRAGVDVTIAAAGKDLQATGRNGITLRADACLDDLEDIEYALVVLPGGPGHTRLRSDPRVIERVRKQAAAGRWVAAICAAPTILHEAGILAGRKYTAHHTIADELPDIITDRAVVTDGCVVTSRGAGTAVEFGLELVALMTNAATAREIAGSIHHRPETG